MSLQFIFYNLTIILIIAHFLDSAHEKEWNEVIYFGNYPFWLISTVLIITFTIIGIIPVYKETKKGDWFSIIVSLGGLSGAGYHIPMNYFGKSDVCNNYFSYCLMYILTVSCFILIYYTIKNLYYNNSKNKNEKIK